MMLTMPDGYSIDSTILSGYALGGAATVVLTNVFGTTHTITMLDPGNTTTNQNAQALCNAITNALNSGATGVVLVSPNGISITGCVPNFLPNLAVNQQTIYVTGTGFNQGMVGQVLNLEDVGGGPDDNGFTFTISQVLDSGNLIATYAGAGDAAVAADMMLYYRNPAGVMSNMLVNVSAT